MVEYERMKTEMMEATLPLIKDLVRLAGEATGLIRELGPMVGGLMSAIGDILVGTAGKGMQSVVGEWSAAKKLAGGSNWGAAGLLIADTLLLGNMPVWGEEKEQYNSWVDQFKKDTEGMSSFEMARFMNKGNITGAVLDWSTDTIMLGTTQPSYGQLQALYGDKEMSEGAQLEGWQGTRALFGAAWNWSRTDVEETKAVSLTRDSVPQLTGGASPVERAVRDAKEGQGLPRPTPAAMHFKVTDHIEIQQNDEDRVHSELVMFKNAIMEEIRLMHDVRWMHRLGAMKSAMERPV